MQDVILPDHGSGHQPERARPLQDRQGQARRESRKPASCRDGDWSRGPELLALGAAVRELRARRGFSQETLGFRAGLHRNYVGAVERGEINPTFRVLLKLSVGLAEPLSELIGMYQRNRMAQLGIVPPREPGQTSGSQPPAGPPSVVGAGGAGSGSADPAPGGSPHPTSAPSVRRAPRTPPRPALPSHGQRRTEGPMTPPVDLAARLALCALLAWRIASVLLRAAGLLYLWAGLIEIATGTGPLAGAGALTLGTAAWLAGHWLPAYRRQEHRSPLAERVLGRRRRDRKAD